MDRLRVRAHELTVLETQHRATTRSTGPWPLLGQISIVFRRIFAKSPSRLYWDVSSVFRPCDARRQRRASQRDMKVQSEMWKSLMGKVAVITGATSGMGLASARLFVEEGAYVFITGRRKEQLAANREVKEIGRNRHAGVQGDAGNLSDLDRLNPRP